MNGQTSRLSTRRIVWSAVSAALWTPGLAFALLGFGRFFAWLGLPVPAWVTNSYFASGAIVFAALFISKIATKHNLGGSSPPFSVIDDICANDERSADAKMRLLLRNWFTYLLLLLLVFWMAVAVYGS